LITQVFKKRDLETAQEKVTKVLLPTKKIKELEKSLNFTKTHENQVALADAYLEINNTEKALEHYECSLSGLFKEDGYVLKQLVLLYYKKGDFKTAVAKGTIIEDNKDFLKSDGLFYYAMALAKSGDQKKATLFFDQINRPFSNYAERLKYGEYLMSIDQKQQAKKIFEELVQESLQASKPVKRKFRTIFIQAKNRLETI
jgi:hypothetical protein